MIDFIILAVVLGIVTLAGGYVYQQKKKGVKCIGCPDGATCSGNCSSCAGCTHAHK